MKTPFDVINEPEFVLPEMSKYEKAELSRWFYRISASILSCSWPENELKPVKDKVAQFIKTAQALEVEAR